MSHPTSGPIWAGRQSPALLRGHQGAVMSTAASTVATSPSPGEAPREVGMSLTQLPAPGAGAGRGVTQECAWGRWEAVRRQSQAGAASQSRQERPRDETLFVVGLFSSVPRGVCSPFPLPSPQRTLVGKMWRVRTNLLGFWEVIEGSNGSCPQQGSPDTSISHSCDFPAVDVLGGAFFCLSWSEEALLAAWHRFPSLLPGSANPSTTSGGARRS